MRCFHRHATEESSLWHCAWYWISLRYDRQPELYFIFSRWFSSAKMSEHEHLCRADMSAFFVYLFGNLSVWKATPLRASVDWPGFCCHAVPRPALQKGEGAMSHLVLQV